MKSWILLVWGGIVAMLILWAFAPVDYGNAIYSIKTEDGTYFVESYTKEQDGECVYLSEYEVRYCGTWTATKLNLEE